MVAEQSYISCIILKCCSLAKISMVAELENEFVDDDICCSLAKISMVAEHYPKNVLR